MAIQSVTAEMVGERILMVFAYAHSGYYPLRPVEEPREFLVEEMSPSGEFVRMQDLLGRREWYLTKKISVLEILPKKDREKVKEFVTHSGERDLIPVKVVPTDPPPLPGGCPFCGRKDA